MPEAINYAIRCFKNQERKMTHELTEKEAFCFRRSALHLADYLTMEHGLPDDTVGSVRASISIRSQ